MTQEKKKKKQASSMEQLNANEREILKGPIRRRLA